MKFHFSGPLTFEKVPALLAVKAGDLQLTFMYLRDVLANGRLMPVNPKATDLIFQIQIV